MICDKCNRPFNVMEEPGALVFSPPENNYVWKGHLCPDCWQRLKRWLATPSGAARRGS